MTIETSKPFPDFVAIEELDRTGDARKFVMRLPFEREGNKVEHWRREWRYSDTEAKTDQNAGVDGFRERREREIEALRHTVERDLRAHHERLYEVPGRNILKRGPLRKG